MGLYHCLLLTLASLIAYSCGVCLTPTSFPPGVVILEIKDNKFKWSCGGGYVQLSFPFEVTCIGADYSPSLDSVTCQPLQCSSLPNEPNKVTVTSPASTIPDISLDTGTVIQYMCNEANGYVVTGTKSGSGAANITCVATGTTTVEWSPQPWDCEVADCGSPPSPGVSVRLTADPSSTTFGSEAVYECNDNYKTTTPADLTIKCAISGWGNAPTCQLITCDSIDTALGLDTTKMAVGSYSGQDSSGNNVVGTTVTLDCNVGLKPVDPVTFTCQATGTWQGPAGETSHTCTVVTCEAPDLSPWGSITSPKSTYNYGEQFAYTCNDGYNYQTSFTPKVSCTETGWTPQVASLECTATTTTTTTTSTTTPTTTTTTPTTTTTTTPTTTTTTTPTTTTTTPTTTTTTTSVPTTTTTTNAPTTTTTTVPSTTSSTSTTTSTSTTSSSTSTSTSSTSSTTSSTSTTTSSDFNTPVDVSSSPLSSELFPLWIALGVGIPILALITFLIVYNCCCIDDPGKEPYRRYSYARDDISDYDNRPQPYVTNGHVMPYNNNKVWTGVTPNYNEMTYSTHIPKYTGTPSFYQATR